jgi:hypothetical protein
MTMEKHTTSANGRKANPDPRIQFEHSTDEPTVAPDLRQCVQDVITAAMEFAQVRVDAIRMGLRGLALRVGVTILATAVASVFLVVSIILLLNGLSGGIAHWLRMPAWAGHLIVGAACVGLPLLVMGLYAKRVQKKWLNELRRKYEQESK